MACFAPNDDPNHQTEVVFRCFVLISTKKRGGILKERKGEEREKKGGGELENRNRKEERRKEGKIKKKGKKVVSTKQERD